MRAVLSFRTMIAVYIVFMVLSILLILVLAGTCTNMRIFLFLFFILNETYNVRHFPMAIIFREKWKKYRRITTV